MTSPDSLADPFRGLADAPAAGPGAPGGAAQVLRASAQAVAHARGLEQRLRQMADTFPTPEERAVEIVDTVLRHFGAAAALSARLTADGATLEVVGATGQADDWGDLLADRCADRAPRVPIDGDGPLPEAVRTGVPVFCTSREALVARYPGLADPLARHGVEAIAALPARHMGRVHGGLVLVFHTPQRFTAADRALLRALAGRYARAVVHARLYYGEHAARADAEAARAAEADARREAERAREEAETANRAKDDFLAVVSHELRTPLQAVLGFSELLDAGLAGPLTARQHEFVQRIQGAGSHLLRVIEDLLGFSRAQAGKEVVHVEVFDVAATVAQVVAMAAPLADRKHVALRLEGPAEGVRFASDPFKVRQIATNLVGNAVKFTGWGEVVARVEAWDRAGRPAGAGAPNGTPLGDGPGDGPSDAEAARVRLTVRDTGVGIPEAKRAAVFEPFVQATEPTTRAVGGTGLGLSIVRQLAGLLGGEVRLAESEVGRGSTFVVELPCVPAARSNGSG